MYELGVRLKLPNPQKIGRIYLSLGDRLMVGHGPLKAGI